MQYVANNLRYPARAQRASVSGKVLVQFVVTKTGSIQDAGIIKSIGFGCDEEAIRIVSQMPKWKPGKQNGKPVAVMYNLPIQFSLSKPQDNVDHKAAYLMHMDSIYRMTLTIRLRGAGPTGQLGKETLYIMNGKETDAKNLKTLQPYAIKKMDVLKESAAKAVYGEKGKNGVVIITTYRQ
jgi:TonB family protein